MTRDDTPPGVRDLVTIDTLLPSQFARPGDGGSPARHLACAVLLQAAADVRPTNRPAQQRAALAWIDDTEDASAYSFSYLCTVLGLDVQLTRAALHRWAHGLPREPATQRRR